MYAIRSYYEFGLQPFWADIAAKIGHQSRFFTPLHLQVAFGIPVAQIAAGLPEGGGRIGLPQDPQVAIAAQPDLPILGNLYRQMFQRSAHRAQHRRQGIPQGHSYNFV